MNRSDIFALGGFDFFCVKGLQSVEKDGTLMACWMADDTFAWTVVTAAGTPWEMREEISWRYASGHEASSADAQAATAARSSLFPVEALVQVYRRGELLSSERTELEFAADGSLAATVRTLSDATTGELLERVTCRYQTSCVGLPLAWSETQDGEGNVVRREYAYDTSRWLCEIVCTSSLAADEAERESYLYASPDEAGNWLVSWQEWNDRVDWNHVTASVQVRREISYFP
ncbi:MAG: hypothetical protein IJ511_03010 [Bacteroides sp.]|nr:hypothetical protein [Bacteroides sp.]